MNCKHCKKKIPPYKGNRKKEFCNSTCRSNHWYAVNKKGKSKTIEYAKENEKSFDGLNHSSIIMDEVGVFGPTAIGLDPHSGKKRQSRKKVSLTDLTKPTGKKVITDPPPATNRTINTMPVRMKGEDAIDFAARKNAWKRKQK